MKKKGKGKGRTKGEDPSARLSRFAKAHATTVQMMQHDDAAILDIVQFNSSKPVLVKLPDDWVETHCTVGSEVKNFEQQWLDKIKTLPRVAMTLANTEAGEDRFPISAVKALIPGDSVLETYPPAIVEAGLMNPTIFGIRKDYFDVVSEKELLASLRVTLQGWRVVVMVRYRDLHTFHLHELQESGADVSTLSNPTTVWKRLMTMTEADLTKFTQTYEMHFAEVERNTALFVPMTFAFAECVGSEHVIGLSRRLLPIDVKGFDDLKNFADTMQQSQHYNAKPVSSLVEGLQAAFNAVNAKNQKSSDAANASDLGTVTPTDRVDEMLDAHKAAEKEPASSADLAVGNTHGVSGDEPSAKKKKEGDATGEKQPPID